MKKSTLLPSVLFLVLLNNCGSALQGLMVYKTDSTLKTITNVRALPVQNAVGFEWEKISDPRVHGVNIYRATPNSGDIKFDRVGSVGNRYATHFVDRHIEANKRYLYTFTTYSVGRESMHGSVLKVQTKSALSGVSFVKAYKVAPTVIKILWAPHANQSINRYVIERSINGSAWKYLTQLDGQLVAEYIDTFVKEGNTYKYRIIAKSYNNVLTKPSQITSVTL